MSNVAENIIDKCGGPKAVSEMTGVDVSQVHRWKYPRDRGGTGGVIPARHQGIILEKALARGIDIHPNDFFDLPTQPEQAAPDNESAPTSPFFAPEGTP